MDLILFFTIDKLIWDDKNVMVGLVILNLNHNVFSLQYIKKLFKKRKKV